jgi:competence protein ComEC
VALCYGAGVVLGHLVEAPLLAVFLVAGLLLFAASSIARWRPFLLPAVVFLLGWLNMTTRTTIISPHDLRSVLPERAEIISVRGRLVTAPSQRVSLRNGVESSHTLAELEVTAVRFRRGTWEPALGRVMSRTSGVLPPQFVVKQTVEVSGLALQPPPPVADGVFDYARYLHSRGIYYELKVDAVGDWKALGAQAPVPLSQHFRTWGQRVLARGLPEQDEALRLQWAMLLGWQTALTAEVSEPFMRSGTMHIFAISGLHIALIAGICVALLRALTLPRIACGLIVIPVIWFYTAATGWQASAIRSSVMMSVIIFGWALKRPTDLVNSLAAAACIILVWQPEQLFQASFQLSFFVVLSLALLSPPIETVQQKFFSLDPLLPYELRPWWQRAGLKIGRVIWTCFATSLAALIGSVPLIAYYFHLFTPGSLLANLVVVPVSSLALMSGLGAIITGDLVPVLTEWFNHSGWIFMRLMTWLSETVAGLPGAWWHMRAPGPLLFFLYYGLLIAVCAGWFMKKTLRWIVLSVALALATAWVFDWKQQRTWHRLTMLPLNGGHAVYVQPARGGREWLINSGERSAVEFTLKPFLQADGVNELANLLLTHGDARYVGGVTRLNEMLPVRRAFVSPIAFRSPRYREAVAELENKSRLCQCATNGLAVGPWTILHPNSSDRFASAEDNIVVALGRFDGVRVLLVSDLGKAGQNAVFVRHPDLRADVVIAGLPPKGEPLADEWLQTLAPKLIVLADAEAPATRRASAPLLARLRRSGAAVLVTRQAGAVTLRVRQGAWRVATARPMSDLEPDSEMEDR